MPVVVVERFHCKDLVKEDKEGLKLARTHLWGKATKSTPARDFYFPDVTASRSTPSELSPPGEASEEMTAFPFDAGVLTAPVVSH